MKKLDNNIESSCKPTTQDVQLKKLEMDIQKAKHIAKLGASAVNSVYLATLFDSQMTLTGLQTKNESLLKIYNNVQALVLYSLKQKDQNSKLDNRVAELLQTVDEKRDQSTLAKLRASISALEKENAQLQEKVKDIEKQNAGKDEYIKTLNDKVQEAAKKMETFDKFQKKNEELQRSVEDLSQENAELEEQCFKTLNEIKEHQKEIEYLDIKCRNANGSVKRLSESEKIMKDENGFMRKMMHELHEMKKHMEDEKEQLLANEIRLKKYIVETEREFKAQTTENTSLKMRVAEYRQKAFPLEKKLVEMYGQQKNLSEANRHLSAANDSLKNNVASMELRNSRQAGELKRLSKSKETLTVLFKKLRDCNY